MAIFTAKLPLMDDPLGRSWSHKPDLRDRVVIYETHATISERDWQSLPRYESSLPSGVYPGKAWRCGKFLKWYGPDIKGKCRICCVRALVQGTGQPITYTPQEGGAV